MDEWAEPALDTLYRDQVWPVASANSQVVVGGGTQAGRARQRDESLHVVDQAVAPFLALWSPAVVASLLSQFLPECLYGPAVPLMRRFSPFPDHAFAEPLPPTR